MKRQYGAWVLSACVLLWCAPAFADYFFQVPSVEFQVFVNPDASAKLVYKIQFHNLGQPIDVVDIGLPHKDYRLDQMRAFIDGEELINIRPSTYVDVGVEVPLGPRAIQLGADATFRFEATLPNLVYQDTTRDDYASLRITPTWFDQNVVNGTTSLKIAIHLPSGVRSSEVLHQGLPFSQKAFYQGHIVATWDLGSVIFVGQHPVALSFPKRGMSRVVVISKWELLERWWVDTVEVRVLLAILLTICFSVFFFRFSAGTGWSVWIVLVVASGFLFYRVPSAQLILTPIFILTWPLMEWMKRRTRKKYLPPIISVEGGGIKRGLTAPEAAVLLERPLSQVLMLVLFGMLKKGLIREEPADGVLLHVSVRQELTQGDPTARLAAAGQLGLVIHEYEHAFLDVLQRLGAQSVAEGAFGDAIRALIEHTATRMIGYAVDETREYYKRIVARAWQEVETLAPLEQRTRTIDKNLEWLLMDPDYVAHFARMTDYHYRPSWSRDQSRVQGVASIAASASEASLSSSTSFSDVAASFAGWAENISGSLAQCAIPAGLGDLKAGAVDLSGFDSATGDIFAALAKGSNGSGGGGGGSSCACAGCACACACAGGGR